VRGSKENPDPGQDEEKKNPDPGEDWIKNNLTRVKILTLLLPPTSTSTGIYYRRNRDGLLTPIGVFLYIYIPLLRKKRSRIVESPYLIAEQSCDVIYFNVLETVFNA
jgi:hypothetical protein